LFLLYSISHAKVTHKSHNTQTTTQTAVVLDGIYRSDSAKKKKQVFAKQKYTKANQAISGDSEVERFKFINIKEKLP
jgi:hypothetical protein